MKAFINDYRLDDIRGPDHWMDDPKEFCVLVDLCIADKEMDGGEIFSLVVCSPKWFENNVLKPEPKHPTHERIAKYAFGRHHLFLEEYDAEEIQTAVSEIVSRAKGKDWSEVALYLSRYFSWEFEDYSPTKIGEGT